MLAAVGLCILYYDGMTDPIATTPCTGNYRSTYIHSGKWRIISGQSTLDLDHCTAVLGLNGY